ncbi:general stress protein [Rhodobacteraceae bacterium]|nr:general stress protein [Paracoccaceae bacterium]
MTDDAKIEKKFWDALQSERFVMLALEGALGAAPRPMTAISEENGGPVWFFTSRDTDLVRNLTPGAAAYMTFSSKGHEIFATMRGEMTLSNDPDVIDRLWNPMIAAWFEGGREDPDLALLCMEPSDAEIWLAGKSLISGLKILLSSDAREAQKENVAHITY